MKIIVTNHAKIRWYERFIGSGNIDGDQITNEILYNFENAQIDSEQDNSIVYKNNNIYFVVDKSDLTEKRIITIYPKGVSDTKLIEEFETIKQKKDVLDEDEKNLEVVIYKKVLNGELTRFPSGFWEQDKGGYIFIGARDCTKYMYENILMWSIVDIIYKSNKETFIKNKLNGMLNVLFNHSWHMAIYNAYPNIKPYMLKNRGRFEEYWKEDGLKKAKEFGVWLKEELNHKGYKFSGKGVLSLKWKKIFKEYKLQSLLRIVFDNNLANFFNVLFDAGITEEDIIRYEINSDKKQFEGLRM